MFLPARISRAMAAQSSARNAQSTTAASAQPIWPDKATATRPASQTENSASKGRPRNGRRPVQFGTAVSRNPATTAPP